MYLWIAPLSSVQSTVVCFSGIIRQVQGNADCSKYHHQRGVTSKTLQLRSTCSVDLATPSDFFSLQAQVYLFSSSSLPVNPTRRWEMAGWVDWVCPKLQEEDIVHEGRQWVRALGDTNPDTKPEATDLLNTYFLSYNDQTWHVHQSVCKRYASKKELCCRLTGSNLIGLTPEWQF